MSDIEKLTRMKADTFRARLRLGLGFAAAVHVPENLKIRDTSITHLCDALCVDGDLDLGGCVNLRTLPERLVVRGRLIIDGCQEITGLPATLRELFGFSAVGCNKLTSIAPIVECRGRLDLAGCTGMSPLPPAFTAVGKVKFKDCWLDYDSVFIKLADLPTTLLSTLPGKRIGEVLAHPVLEGHPVLEAQITEVIEMDSWKGILLYADTSALIHKPLK
jgi:hypothetical protein